MSGSEKIPLFPLGLVVLPEMQLPLHIFEDRYKKLAARCIDRGEPFGIVYYNGTTLLRHGSTVSIDQIIRTYADGRFDLVATGHRRFFLTRLFEDQPYIEADVTYYDDESDIYDSPIQDLAQDALRCLQKIAALSGKHFEPADFMGIGLKRLSFLLSATDILTVEEKQESLESVSVRYRFERIITAAKRHIERMTSAQKLKEILGEDQDTTYLFN